LLATYQPRRACPSLVERMAPLPSMLKVASGAQPVELVAPLPSTLEVVNCAERPIAYSH
jgi:hypothetical protein